MVRSQVQTAISLLADSIYRTLSRPRRQPDLREQILVVRVDGLGDFVLWLAAARAFRLAYPPDRFEITLVANEAWAELAEQLPYFDRVLPLDRKRFVGSLRYRRHIARQLRTHWYDLVVHPTHSRDLVIGDSIVHLTASTKRVAPVDDGANSSPAKTWWAARWYTELVPVSNESVAELSRNIRFMSHIGVDVRGSAGPVLPPIPSQHLHLPDQPFIVLFPGGAFSLKRWPAERFANVALGLSRVSSWTFVVCGANSDAAQCQAIMTTLSANGISAVDRHGKTSLSELLEIIRSADLVISNDTGAAHIAASVSTPCVSIVGGGHFGRFFPYVDQGPDIKAPSIAYHALPCFGCHWRCPYQLGPESPAPCITAVTTESVISLAANLLTQLSRGEQKCDAWS